jgi:hypothetical protein
MMKGIVTSCEARIKTVPITDQYSVYCGTENAASTPRNSPERHFMPKDMTDIRVMRVFKSVFEL